MVAVAYYVLFSLVWTVAHELSDLRAVRLPLTFDWESRIPFQPWILPLYFSLDVAVISIPLVFRNAREAFPPMALFLAQVVVAALRQDPYRVLCRYLPGGRYLPERGTRLRRAAGLDDAISLYRAEAQRNRCHAYPGFFIIRP